MTDPLTPPDCDLRDFAFMPLDIMRLFNSRFHAISSDSEWRAGLTLWLKSFHQVPASSLPEDDVELCRLAELGRDQKAWRKVKAVALHGWVKCSDGRLYHPVVAEKANEAWTRKTIQRERSRKGNAARWRHGVDCVPQSQEGQGFLEGEESGVQDATEGPQEESLKESFKESFKESLKDRKGQGQGQGQGQGSNGNGNLLVAEPPDAAGAATTPPRGARLAVDWVLPKAWGEWALAEFPGWTADGARLEAAKFRDHWVAKTGKDATKADWAATWRNWCRNAKPKPGTPVGGPPLAATAARNAEAKKLLGFGPADDDFLPHEPTAITGDFAHA